MIQKMEEVEESLKCEETLDEEVLGEAESSSSNQQSK